MKLKRALLDCLLPAQLKELCAELEVEADRRSQEAMVNALALAWQAKPGRLIEKFTIEQLRKTLELQGRPTGGRKGELVGRLLGAEGGAAAAGAKLELRADEAGERKTVHGTSGTRTRRNEMGEKTEQYRHAEQAVQRPDVGVQDQFQAKKPPRTYRHDSSLDPTLSWDEQRERDLGEWLLALIERAAKEGEKAVFSQAQEWKGGGVRIASIADAVRLIKDISKPFLNWAGKAERREIRVPTVPLFVHERHSTKAILDGIRHRKARGSTLDLFGDPNMDIRDQLEAYEHKGPWQNRMILGDSLSVMNSLLEFEGLGGQIQMIYIDPPYGVKFGSNFQPFIRNRTVKDSADTDLTREPEMVKAYRDTWELGLHSYLTYLRDRTLLARELLNPSGSIFLQISDENLHHVREVLDEVFGRDNFCSLITFRKKMMPMGSEVAEAVSDYILWYCRDRACLKSRPIFRLKPAEGDAAWAWMQLPDGSRRRLTTEEIGKHALLPQGARVFQPISMLPAQYRPKQDFEFVYAGESYVPPKGSCWKTDRHGMEVLASVHRLHPSGKTLRYVLFHDDYPISRMTNLWSDTSGADNQVYVVQTNTSVVKRCLLMTTDPGDLVLDPTCGSGTTAYVAEQWGRRWITIDTSRVPLALARQRLLTATFCYYELKEPGRGPAGGFVYNREQNRKGEEVGGLVPHITLKSITNDEPPAMELLVDRPDELSSVTRVSGPFVVEATIAPVQPLEEAGDGEHATSDVATHLERMTEVLRQSKTLRLPGNRELTLAGIRRTVDAEYLHAEAKEGEKRVAIVFGPPDGAVSASLVYEAGREAHYLKYDRIYFFGFAVEPNARCMIEEEKKLRIPAVYVAVTPDVAMSDLLKTTRASEIFSITGLPDFEVRIAKKKGPEGQSLYEVELSGLDLFDPESLKTESVDGQNVPCWMLDSDYDGMGFYATQVFFPRTSAWDNLQKSLKATFEESVWTHLAGTVSEPFALGERKRVAVKVIDERGNELLRIKDVAE